ncbi:tRNA-adenosine deaminase [Thermaerobacter marianensis DSM 12885]|uniref:tRNA-specific adenosine deaminase n=1 Tax=Thermaerobacter marianensis (strain ATCC 700841 / DSM 12885 / JCM 10246 / 7p75a) TaxID=644966 RepID=E6SKK9_THEM7|nr:tRNA-adenosine deaminase [Thermaerobacter marianensis DSM 12885]
MLQPHRPKEPATATRAASGSPRGPEASQDEALAAPAARPAPDDPDVLYMAEALAEARRALALGEVPVGAVAVHDGRIIARGHNLRERLGDPTAHAEILVLREAAARLGGWRLEGVTLYVTLEPCPMCAGAIVLARVPRLVYGAPDPKAGAAGSLMNLVQHDKLNHRVELRAGVLAEASAALLRGFFRQLRGAGDPAPAPGPAETGDP